MEDQDGSAGVAVGLRLCKFGAAGPFGLLDPAMVRNSNRVWGHAAAFELRRLRAHVPTVSGAYDVVPGPRFSAGPAPQLEPWNAVVDTAVPHDSEADVEGHPGIHNEMLPLDSGEEGSILAVEDVGQGELCRGWNLFGDYTPS